MIDRLYGIEKFLTLDEVEELTNLLLKAKISNQNEEAAFQLIIMLYPDDNEELSAKVIRREYRRLINSLENSIDREGKANDLKRELDDLREKAQFAYELQHLSEDELYQQQATDIFYEAVYDGLDEND